jgi:diphthine-ammonia ligase
MSGVAVAWTGGKDSCLSFYEAERLGYKVDCLVTFAWSQETFLAHPLNFITLQAEALERPHYTLDVAEPFDQGYEDALSLLKERHGIDVLITGDIGEVAGHDPNWLVERSAHCNVEVIRPLWHISGIRLLNRLLELGFRVVFSCVKMPWFTDEWLGKELSATTIQQLIEIDQRIGLDICGEQGEYHTLAIYGPQFRKRIRIESYSKHVHDSMMYIRLESIQLEQRTEQ